MVCDQAPDKEAAAPLAMPIAYCWVAHLGIHIILQYSTSLMHPVNGACIGMHLRSSIMSSVIACSYYSYQIQYL